jgi:hypothetical protein
VHHIHLATQYRNIDEFSRKVMARFLTLEGANAGIAAAGRWPMSANFTSIAHAEHSG